MVILDKSVDSALYDLTTALCRVGHDIANSFFETSPSKFR